MKDSSFRQKLANEVREFLAVFLFLAPFLLAITSYRMYLRGDFSSPYIAYGMSLLSALVLSKIILIGEFIKLGGRSRNRPSLSITVEKAAVFTLFISMFHLLEDGVRGSLHGEGFLETIHAKAFVNIGELFASLLFQFFAFIPFFALLETRRVLGVDRFREVFLGTGHRKDGSIGTRQTGEPMIKEHL